MTATNSKAFEFFTAVKAGDLPAVQRLVEADPSLVTVRDGAGATALHYAALVGKQDLCRYLVENRADVNARDKSFDATPAGWAIEHLRELGGFLAIEIEDMLFAIRQGDVRWVQRFLTRLPALARCADGNGKPLSQHAQESENPEIAQLFGKPTHRS
jgi:hypothetical protein